MFSWYKVIIQLSFLNNVSENGLYFQGSESDPANKKKKKKEKKEKKKHKKHKKHKHKHKKVKEEV